MIYSDTLSLIGDTPVVSLPQFNTGDNTLYLKLESNNPTGSIKDRIALKMVEGAEKSGALKAGDTIVEATAGNTGLGLALVASQKDYKLKIVMPDKMSREKADALRAYGAEVIFTRSDVAKGHPEYYQDIAARLAKENDWHFINQFENELNWQAHYESTGPEIWTQMQGDIDAVVIGVGSGGTLTGLGRYLKEKNPNIDIVLADPEGSILTHYHETDELIEAGSWLIEGIGEDFIPRICDMSLVDKAYTITDQESFSTARSLMKKSGLIAGSSSGTLLAAALRYCQDHHTKRVLTFVCDTGNRYLSKMYNEDWLRNQNLLD